MITLKRTLSGVQLSANGNERVTLTIDNHAGKLAGERNNILQGKSNGAPLCPAISSNHRILCRTKSTHSTVEDSYYQVQCVPGPKQKCTLTANRVISGVWHRAIGRIWLLPKGGLSTIDVDIITKHNGYKTVSE